MSTLEGWAVTVVELGDGDLAEVDHTYVVAEGKKFPCGGRDKGGRRVAKGDGSKSQAECIWSWENAGITWGVNGLCHQAANRLLYPARRTVKDARGYGVSLLLFGTYGSDPSLWAAIQRSCVGHGDISGIPEELWQWLPTWGSDPLPSHPNRTHPVPPGLPELPDRPKPPDLPIKPPDLPIKPPDLPIKPPDLPIKPPNLPIKPPNLPIKPPKIKLPKIKLPKIKPPKIFGLQAQMPLASSPEPSVSSLIESQAPREASEHDNAVISLHDRQPSDVRELLANELEIFVRQRLPRDFSTQRIGDLQDIHSAASVKVSHLGQATRGGELTPLVYLSETERIAMTAFTDLAKALGRGNFSGLFDLPLDGVRESITSLFERRRSLLELGGRE